VLAAVVTLASLVGLLLVIPNSAFISVPLCLSAAFTVTAFLLAVSLVSTLGWSALPNGWQLVRWLASSGLGVAGWKVISLHTADGAQLSALLVFLGVYSLSIGFLFPDGRREAARFVRAAANRAGWRQ
jgi:hypothetical protein